MAASIDNPAWVEWMTTLMGVSRRSYATTLPPDRFYCLLDELPMHLIPPRHGQAIELSEEGNDPLYLNPDVILCREGQLPDELSESGELLSAFALQGTMAWVRDMTIGCLLPFWLGPKLEAVVEGLRAGGDVRSLAPSDARGALEAAGILVREGEVEPRLRQHEARMARAAGVFQKKGYAPLADLIHPFHVAALRRYYRYLIRTGAIGLGDGQSPRRYVAYNEPVARFFHRQIGATLSAVGGEPLKPSYVYLASYLSGAELRKHTDRKQCEFSVTFCLDFSPEPALETSWPIRLDTATGTVAVYQALGDGLAYRGTRLPHYRDRLPEGHTSTSIFFHYVSADFTGSLD